MIKRLLSFIKSLFTSAPVAVPVKPEPKPEINNFDYSIFVTTPNYLTNDSVYIIVNDKRYQCEVINSTLNGKKVVQEIKVKYSK